MKHRAYQFNLAVCGQAYCIEIRQTTEIRKTHTYNHPYIHTDGLPVFITLCFFDFPINQA